jgi:transcriptional regulator with XRE-family HTH domain
MVDSLGPAARSRVQSKKMTPTDALVGQRIKFRRRLVGLSLEELAAKLQIAPQQLQKYESAHNRVTAGRLLALAEILEVPIQWFFERQVEDHGVPEQVAEQTDPRS